MRELQRKTLKSLFFYFIFLLVFFVLFFVTLSNPGLMQAQIVPLASGEGEIPLPGSKHAKSTFSLQPLPEVAFPRGERG